ncbi:MAG: MBL fold metallo-hydrolase [Planctomycetes bacterium]|nr:MBL fold metallo-hydrolase [Planctomycetota bacterium]
MRTLTIGRYRVTGLRDRDFRLDGGAMFGIVPRVIWEKLEPPRSNDYTVPIATRPLLVEGAKCGPILIEPGIGGRWDARARKIYQIDESRNILNSLEQAGMEPGKIRCVVLTHFHLDHAGAAIRCDAAAPEFVNARHWIPKIELEVSLARDSARRASYRPDDAEILLNGGLLDTFDSETLKIDEGITIHQIGGHSDGVSIITIEGGGDTLCFWSDVVPTRNHVNPNYIMAYDLNVQKSFEVRRRWIQRAVDGNWIGALYHDPEIDFVYFKKDGGAWSHAPLSQ